VTMHTSHQGVATVLGTPEEGGAAIVNVRQLTTQIATTVA
jgi:hypothetical protein